MKADRGGAYQPRFEASFFVDQFERDGKALLAIAQSTGATAQIPSCPGWSVGELITHLGFVYRWAAAVLGEARAAPPAREDYNDRDPLDTVGALERTAAAHEAFVGLMRQAEAARECWTIWPVPEPSRDFWIRRMVSETLVHRVDVENAKSTHPAGGESLDPTFAADGLDELICGFAGRYSKRLRTESGSGSAARIGDI